MDDGLSAEEKVLTPIHWGEKSGQERFSSQTPYRWGISLQAASSRSRFLLRNFSLTGTPPSPSTSLRASQKRAKQSPGRRTRRLLSRSLALAPRKDGRRRSRQ